MSNLIDTYRAVECVWQRAAEARHAAEQAEQDLHGVIGVQALRDALCNGRRRHTPLLQFLMESHAPM